MKAHTSVVRSTASAAVFERLTIDHLRVGVGRSLCQWLIALAAVVQKPAFRFVGGSLACIFSIALHLHRHSIALHVF
jgi:hypothetical protein